MSDADSLITACALVPMPQKVGALPGPARRPEPRGEPLVMRAAVA